MFGVVLLVCDDKGQQRNGFASSRRHFKDTVTPSVEGPFEIAHVSILFRVNSRIGEENREATATKSADCSSAQLRRPCTQ